MMRILKLFVLQVVMIMAPISAWADVESKAEKFDWDPVMDAIIQVESSGNPRAVSGIYAGVLQIAPVLVKDCNNILKSRGEKKRYTLSDRFNEKKSREMFVIIQSYYNPQNNVEKAIRLWNGGVGYKVASTQRYYNKVMSHMR
jgi:hypothetical protein